MAKCVRKAFVFAPLLIVFVFGGLLLWNWGVGRDDSDAICGTLVKDDPTNEATKIVATGKFTSHNEGFIYIGDIVEFELVVVYDHDRVEVKERSMLNLNLSPYKVLSQGDVVSKRHPLCSEKTIHFTLQALDVDPGSKNILKQVNSEGYESKPEIEYAGDGLVRTISPNYEAPYVATITGGEIRRLPDNAEKYPLPQKKQREKTWQDTARFSLGIVLTLWLIVWVGLPRVINKTKRKVAGKELTDPRDLFPELYQDGDAHTRLVSAYFRLEGLLDASLLKKASRVFSGLLTKVDEEAIILELRAYVEGRYGNDGLA